MAKKSTSISTKKLKKDTEQLLALFSVQDATALERASRKFIQDYPKLLLGYKGLAASFGFAGLQEDALAVIDDALRVFPEDSELHNNKAAALLGLGRAGQAIESCDKAIALNPANADAYSNRGLALKEVGEWGKALQSYHLSLGLNPMNASALNNAGVTLMLLERPAEAVACFQAALAVAPKRNDIRVRLAFAKEEQKATTEACEDLAVALRNNATDDYARSGIIFLLRTAFEFEAAADHTKILLERLRSGNVKGDVGPFFLLSLEDATAEDHLRAAKQHASASIGHLLASPPLVQQRRETQVHRPLHIGYLSADFSNHATSILIAGAMEHHDRARVKTFAYSSGPNDSSDLRKRMEKAFDVFRDIRNDSIGDTANQIVADEIDILVDLKGYTKYARLEVCAMRPAPIIVSWLGYPGSLGCAVLADYIIGDPIVTPLGHQQWYSETIAQMPHCYQSNDDARLLLPAPSRKKAGLPSDAFVFCSFNQPYKISARVFDQWCRILSEVPGSVLWLLSCEDDAKSNLHARAKRNGIPPERLIFADKVAPDDHVARLQLVDIALDAFPYTSHTTGADALWAGVPLISIKGNTFASRVSASLVTNVGLEELVTNSPEEAANLAILLAQDRSRLAEIKSRLADRKSSPLFDTKRFTRDLERLYMAMWEQHLAGKRAPIVLSPQA